MNLKLTSFIVALFTCCLCFSQTYYSESFEFKAGQSAYMFGDNVKMRTKPNKNSEVIKLLRIGEKILILEKSNTKMLFNGINFPWYKIKYNDKIGFVLGGLISVNKFSDNNSTFLVTLKKDSLSTFIKIRYVKQDFDYIETKAKLSTNEFYINLMGNKGLNTIDGIFEIQYMAEACGVDGGGIYFFYANEQLIKAIEYSIIADADVYWFHEEYSFPNDENGVKGKIVYRREEGEKIDDETNWIERKSTQRLLEWKEGEITPKIELNKE